MTPNPCPKCNGKWMIYLIFGTMPDNLGYYVKCQDCGLTTRTFKKQNKAVKAWNEGEVK